jgi:hypothetical protein
MARPPLLSVLCLLLLYTHFICRTTSVSSSRKTACDVRFGKYTSARTPLKICTTERTAEQIFQRHHLISGETVHAMVSYVRKNPTQSAVLSLMVYIRIAHPKFANGRKNFFHITGKEAKALAISWLLWKTDRSWLDIPFAWLKTVWRHVKVTILRLVKRFVTWWTNLDRSVDDKNNM